MKRFKFFGLIPFLFLSLLAPAIYLNSLNNSFLFDDMFSIVENHYIRDLGNIPLFIKGVKIYGGWFRMLPTLSFALHYHFHRLNVLGYHLVNLILHVLSGIFVFLISRYLLTLGFKKKNLLSIDPIDLKDKRITLLSLLVASVFISHPIQVNTVTYIIQRNEGLSSLFYLLSFFLFIKGSLNHGRIKFLYFLGTGLSFLGSVLSKEIGFTLPIILILFDLLFICKNKKDMKKRIKIYFPLLIGLFVYILFFLRGGILHLFAKAQLRWTPWENILTQSNVILQYGKLLFLPLPHWLNVDHDFNVSKSIFEFPTWISLTAILLLLIFATLWIKKNRLISFSIYWFFIVLAPTSSLIPIEDIMVEYRLYLPLFSYALLLTLGFHYLYKPFILFLPKKINRITLLGIPILLLFFYSLITIERNKVFKDDLSLWSDATKKSSEKTRPKINLIAAYHRYGFHDQAIATSLEVLKKEPQNHEIYTKLGVSYMFLGEYDKAIDHLMTSIQMNPRNHKAYNNLGVLFLGRRDFDQGISYLKQAIFYHPNYSEAYNNLAKALVMKGLLDEAIKEERKAIQIDPTVPEYHFNLAKFYENKEMMYEAIQKYKEAMKWNPKFFEAYYHLGMLYSKMGRHREAILEFEEAIKINPRSGKIYFMLGVNFIKLRNREKAISNFEKALQHATNEKDIKAIESVLSQLKSSS